MNSVLAFPLKRKALSHGTILSAVPAGQRLKLRDKRDSREE